VDTSRRLLRLIVVAAAFALSACGAAPAAVTDVGLLDEVLPGA